MKNKKFITLGFASVGLSLALLLSPSLLAKENTSDEDKEISRLQSLAKFTKVISIVEQYNVDDLDIEDLMDKAIEGMLTNIDAHSNYLKKKDYKKLKVQTEVKKNSLKEQIIYQQSKQAALGELLMHIAHQWKQPLASLGSVNLLNKTKIETGITISNDDILKSIGKSEDIIEFMAETIDTFKNFYEQSNENKYFFIADSVIDILSIVEATFYFDNINIYIISHEEEKTFGNINEFSQVIFSILNNARDIIKLRNIENPEINILIENKMISIRDNAGGIEEELLEDIFLPSMSTNDSTGIGLYISKNIVEKNGGVITASNYKDGAIFTIELFQEENE